MEETNLLKISSPKHIQDPEGFFSHVYKPLPEEGLSCRQHAWISGLPWWGLQALPKTLSHVEATVIEICVKSRMCNAYNANL